MGRDLVLDLVTQRLIQPSLEHFQGRDSHSFSGQPVPIPYHPHSKKFLPDSNLRLFPLVLSLHVLVTEFHSSFLVGSLRVLEGAVVLPEPSLLQAGQPQLSQACLHSRGAPAL